MKMGKLQIKDGGLVAIVRLTPEIKLKLELIKSSEEKFNLSRFVRETITNKYESLKQQQYESRTK